MKITNNIKGQITQTIVRMLFEYANYRVIPFGVEEIFQEVRTMGAGQYQELGLPPAMRTSPDFLVVDASQSKAFLVEVKYRANLTMESITALREKLIEQRQYWPDVYVVIIRSLPEDTSMRFYQDYIRVLRSDRLNDLLPTQFTIERSKPERFAYLIWEKLPRLHDVFDGFVWSQESNSYRATDCGDEVVGLIQALKHLAS